MFRGTRVQISPREQKMEALVMTITAEAKITKEMKRRVSGKSLTLNLRTNHTRKLYLSRAYKVGDMTSYRNATMSLYDGLMSNTNVEHIQVLDLQIDGKSYKQHMPKPF